MHITELRLHGFKSFVDPARAPIEQGLTGVVGPNGCGKSNLLEGVRWVMGATSAKSMRASDMEDVIFSGTAGRPAREHAEVTLVLNDALGQAPAPFNKEDVLEVSRRIRRGLGSTYRINGKEVRAKDVQLLFADAATGANSPALVRQGQISELIAAKPQNRRRILEDAAGIAGLHARRHEADLKLKAAETNLTRLDEILAEIENQAASLKKQARQAERYRDLAQTLRETEALLLHRRWTEARERAAEAQGHLREAERVVAQAASEASAADRAAEEARDGLTPLREEELVAAAVLRRLEGVRVGLERDLADAEAAIARCDEDASRNRAEAERLEALKRDASEALGRLIAEADALGPGDADKAQAALKAAQGAEVGAASVRADAEKKLEQIASDAAARRARAQALTDAANAARARLARLEERKRALDGQAKALPASGDLDAKRAAAVAAAEKARADGAKLRATLTEAEAALRKAEAADEAAWTPYRASESALNALEAEVKALDKLAPPDSAKFPPVLASIDVERGYEKALAAALGEDIDASMHADAPARWGGAAAPAPHLPAEAQSLARFVKAPEALAARLSLIGIVEAKDGARLAKQLPPGARLVSVEGDLWRWDGFVRRADAPQPAAARLEHKNRLAAARAELKAAEAKLAKAKVAWEAAKAERSKLEAKARDLRAEAPKSAAADAAAAREVERLDAELARLSERRGDLDAQAKALEAEFGDARAALADAEGAAKDAPATGDDPGVTAARAAVDAARAKAAEAAAAAQSLVRDKTQRDTRRGAVEIESKQWKARIGEADTRLGALSKELDQIEKRRDAAKAAPGDARARLEALMDEAGAAEQRRASTSDRVAEAEAAARAAGERARSLEQAHADAREKRASTDAHAQANAARVQDVVTLANEQAGVAPEALAARAGALLTSAMGTSAIAEIEKRFERLRSERDAAGPVNLRADEEFAEARERIATLTREKDDVAQAVAKLRRAITTLNNEGRTRLLRAFEEVDAHFAQLFATLFDGGQAALKLTESEDPLEAGLEIFAQPPGKRLTNLNLLSGGEQALTATALIFAVFLANPAPLCVLDEVDAPLDDANVDRFCRMLEEMKRLTTTRFIVITHNPVTMSRMDRLYGVTMPEQGLSQLVSVDLGRAQAMAAE
ncbi:chromosome segregation protein SMC [Terricaulis silvestris]|uniref:Chromosome partition protein Smc n=1 Tax=Terricaulis silvestris TaxID=2686094 RepID=A0A6I6MNT0_9CAUL|nr:chromosome segregation protein SMC [Terricaulis silvestris]QGZ95781.1 Chromosome partition protein Smc [Terricaulis silvestris]